MYQRPLKEQLASVGQRVLHTLAGTGSKHVCYGYLRYRLL